MDCVSPKKGCLEHKSEREAINKLTLSQSHHRSKSSETAVPITVLHDNYS